MCALVLSFNPFPELRIAFLECETFFLGTARRNGGRRSNKGANEGMVKEIGKVGANRNSDDVVVLRRENTLKAGRTRCKGVAITAAMVW